MKMRKKTALRGAAVLLLAVTLLTVAGCSAVAPTPRANQVVAKAGNVKILYDELYYIANNGLAQMRADAGDTPLEESVLREKLTAFVWENLLTKEVALRSIGYDYDIDVLKGDIAEQVNAQLADIIDKNFEGKTSAYVESLDQSYVTDRYVRLYIGVEDYLPTAIVKAMMETGELDVSDETAMATIRGEQFLRTVHVFIGKNDGIFDDRDKAHAEGIYNKLIAITDDGDRYAAMREEIGGAYNTDFSDTTGHGYYFAKGEMAGAYEEAAFALEEYGVSPVVETEDGYYVIMRMPKEESYIREHFETLKGKTYFITLNSMVDARFAEMTLEKTGFGERLDMLSLPRISAGGGRAFYITTGVIAGVLVILAVALFAKKKIKKSK